MANKKMSAKTKKKGEKNITVVGALCPTGVGAKLSPEGGGKIYRIKH